MKHLRILITAMLIAWFAQVDAQIKISALPTLTAPDSSADWIPIVHSGTTYKVTPGKLFNEFGGGGGASVAGSNTQIQYNNSGAFGADNDFTFNNSSGAFSLGGTDLPRFLQTSISGGYPKIEIGDYLIGDYNSTGMLIDDGPEEIHLRSDALFDVNTTFQVQGNNVNIKSAGTIVPLKLFELAANGTNYTGFQSPDSRSANLIYTLPSTDPTSGQLLVAGSPSGGVVGLTWATDAGTSPGGSDTQIQFNDGGVFGGNANFTYNKTINRLVVGQILTGGTLSAQSGGKLTLTADYIGHASDWGRIELDDHLLELHPDGTNSATFGIAFLGTGSTNGVTLKAALATGNYTLVWPTAQGSANTFLKNDGSGNLSWATAGGSGTVTSIATTSPITGGTITTTGTIGINDAAADGSTKGAASFTAADFNSSTGLISLDYTNGQAASGSTKGFLTSADWTTFNGKQAAGSYLTADGAVVGALSQLQAFTSGIGTGLIDDNGAGEFLINVTGADRLGVYTTGLQTVSGSAASPSYSFFSDNTSGLYLKTANTEIGASVNGALVGGFNTAGLFANIISEMSAANGVTIDGVNLKDGLVAGQYGGTGVNNSGKTITLGGNLETSGANNVTFTTSGATNVTLPTSGTLVNSAVTTLSSLASIGTVTTGTWNASVLTGQYGGTGVANTGKTLTLSGNTTIGSSTHTVDFATGANTSVTLPASGTLATLAGTETFTNKSIVGTQLTGTAYTFAANNTNATAAYTLQRYEDHDLATYSGTVDFNGTDPSSITSQQYAWSRVGNTVTLFFSIFYGTPGTTNTSATFTMPSDLPAPATFATGGDAASEYIFPISGARVEANMTANPSAVRGGLRRNAANDGYEVLLIFGSVSAAHVSFTLSYRTQ